MPNHVTTRCVVVGPEKDVDRFISESIHPMEKDWRGCDRHFDFQTIIPMPECLSGTESGSEADMGIAALTGVGAVDFLRYPWVRDLGITTPKQFMEWVKANKPQAIAKGQQSLDARKATGHDNWYDWSISNWGTKWNSYSFNEVGKRPVTRNTRLELRAAFEGDGGDTSMEFGEQDVVYEFTFDTAWSFPEPVFNALEEKYPTLQFFCAVFDEGWCFAGKGAFGVVSSGFESLNADARLYGIVYGHPPERDEDDEDEDLDEEELEEVESAPSVPELTE